MKLLLQCVFEQLYDFGIREFCFIIGRGKRAIEDHFTQDYGYLKILEEGNQHIVDLERFYDRLSDSSNDHLDQPA